MKIGLVCSHGGHLTEVLEIIDAFEGHDVFFISYDGLRTRELEYRKYLFKDLGKTYPRSILMLTVSAPMILGILLKEKPDVVVSTGPEIAIPVFYVAKILGIKTIFVESWCRVKELSLTGKLVYSISDFFFVQWEQLLTKCGKRARYGGGVI